MGVMMPHQARRPKAAPVRRTTPPALLFGIGAPKCGTTWLHDYLSSHPDCHFRAFKELHYFDTLQEGKFTWLLDFIQTTIERKEDALAVAGPEESKHLLGEIVDMRDYLALMKQRKDDRHGYSRYLVQGVGLKKLVGDITPNYALVPAPVLAEMARMTRETRFVYLMRDPVDRLWSHVRMDVRGALKDGEDYLQKSREHLADLLEERAKATELAYRFSDYKAVIEKLRAAVPAEKSLILFQEDMMTPAGVKRLCSFLGIRHVAADFGKEVNAGRPVDLPEEDRAAMRRALRPQYEYVAQNFSNLPASWQRTMSEGFA